MFHENWFGNLSQRALADLARSTEQVDGAVIEVGCWEGRSTVALANAVHPTTVHAVDHWLGSAGEISAELAAERDVYDAFLENVSELTEGNVVPHRMMWEEFFAELAEPIRFLHIDAEHSYEAVRTNIETALPWMLPGSVMCGDDNHHPPVAAAVVDTLGVPQLVATLWVWRF